MSTGSAQDSSCLRHSKRQEEISQRLQELENLINFKMATGEDVEELSMERELLKKEEIRLVKNRTRQRRFRMRKRERPSKLEQKGNNLSAATNSFHSLNNNADDEAKRSWTLYQSQFPLLVACPFLSESTTKEGLVLCEMDFLEKLSAVCQGRDPSLAIQDILTLTGMRNFYLQTSISHGEEAARTEALKVVTAGKI